LNCTKIQVLQETEYPESYYKVVRFLEYIESDSEKVTGSIYHDRTLFRVSFYQEIEYGFCKSKSKYPETIYTLVIYPTVRFYIHVPAVLGDFRIDSHVQASLENLFTPSYIRRDINDPRYFPHNPSLDDWYKRQKREPDYVIETYTALRPLEITTGVRQGGWRERIVTFYQHQQINAEINGNGRIRSIKDCPQVGKVHKHLIDEAAKSRKRRKTAATWYVQK
jgi:hypothetical protein